MTYDNTNRGALFRNEKKENDKQPDYTGKINVDGVDKRLAAWVSESRAGKKYFSIRVSEFQEQQAGGDQGRQQSGGGIPEDDFDDDIPF